MKVTQVEFEVELEGSGIVNYDSGAQRVIWNRESRAGNKNKFSTPSDNNKYAKKVYTRGDDGALNYQIKISPDCVRNAIFSSDAISVSPNIVQHKVLLNSFIGSALGLVRGYTFANKKETYTRKSPLSISHAGLVNKSESFMEISTKSGDKNKDPNDEKSGITLRNTEAIGDTKYIVRGTVDVALLELLSCDTIHDRYSFNSDDYGILKTFLGKNLPNFKSELGYHMLKTSSIVVAEYGVKFEPEQVLFLIKEVLKRVLKVDILRATARAKVSNMKISLSNGEIKPKEWIDIKSIGDIDDLDFEIEEFYNEVNDSDIIEQRRIIEEGVKKDIEKENNAKKLKEDKGKKK